MCPACGEPTTRLERKVVTVLFADLAGYTSLAESLDPEEVYSVVRPWMTELRLIVEDHGGTVPQVMGDGFMAVFGVPATHEDDPQRAVRAGLALAEHGARLAARQSGVRFPGLRVGINTGEVIVAGSREPSGFAVIGDPVNVSARLAGLAEPGQVFVGEWTNALTRTHVRYGRRLVRPAKGKLEPIPIYEALAVRRVAAPAAATRRGAFVGRSAILARLLAEAVAVRQSGSSRLRVVVAEPGVGKSRLADELRLRLPDFRVLAGASHPYGQRLPLAALAEAIAGALGVPAQATPGRSRLAIARYLRGRNLEAADLERARTQFESVLGVAADPTAREDSRTDRPGGVSVDASLAARAALSLLIEGRPTLVILDDVHWADADQLTFLSEVQRAAWLEPVLFLALTRPEPVDWRRGLPTHHLRGLRATDARQVIRLAIGSSVPAGVADRLVARAGGNPLFLEESARMLVERGALERRAKTWALADESALERVPASLRQLVAARLDRLPAPAKRVAQYASVAGLISWDLLLARLAGSADERGPTSLGAAIAELEARDILRRRPSSGVPGATELEFKHVVIRDVAYESLPRADRAERHALVGDWLREVQGEQAIASVAHHYERAWELGRSSVQSGADQRSAGLASTYLRRWADSVFSVQPRLALSLYERGLRIADAEPSAVATDELAWLHIGRAEALSEAGRHREAITAAEAAHGLSSPAESADANGFALLALARAHSDLGAVGVARGLVIDALALLEQSGSVLGQARAHHRLAEAQRFDDLPGQVRAYRRAYALYGRAGAARERGVVAEDLAYLLTVVGGREADKWLGRAGHFAERSGDERGRAAVRRAGAYSAFYRGDLDGALRAAIDARAPAATIGHRWIEVDTLLIEALVRSAAGSPIETLRIVRRLLSIADSVGARHLRALVLGAGARAAQRDGHPRRAMLWMRAMRATLGELGAQMEMAEVSLLEATLHLERGAWDRVDAPARTGEQVARTSGWRLLRATGPLLRGRALLGAGRVGAAERELRRALRLAQKVGAIGPALVAEASLRQAIAARQDGQGEPLRPLPSTPPVELLAATTGRGLLLGREPSAIDLETEGLRAMGAGDPLAAAAKFGGAVRVWQVLGLTVWQARAERMRADALEAAGRHSAAGASARRAQAILRRLDSPLDRG